MILPLKKLRKKRNAGKPVANAGRRKPSKKNRT
jgi:hypothetical protein